MSEQSKEMLVDLSVTAPKATLLSAACTLAFTNPEQFLNELEWSISSDLSVLDSYDGHNGFAATFHDKAWYESWLKASGKNTKIRILIGQIANTPVIVLPLFLHRSWGVTKASFIAGDVSDYNQPIFHKAFAERISSEFFQAIWCKIGPMIEGADTLSLRKLLDDPGPGCGRAIWHPSRIESEASHHTDIYGNWEENQERFFGKSTQKSLSRKEKKISAAGEISYLDIRGKTARLNAVETLCRWKSHQLQKLGLSNPFISGEFQQFLTEMVRTGDPNIYRIYGMYSGSVPLALTLMICNGDHWFLYQTAYTDEEAGKNSPGMSLLREIMKRAHAEGCKAFDFGLGNEGYKKKYCDRHLTLYRSEIALSWKGWISKAYFDAVQATRTLVKSNKLVEGWALSFLQMLESLRRPNSRT